MGTSIRLEIYKGENTTSEQWEKMTEYVLSTFDDVEEGDLGLVIPIVYTSYRMAEIEAQFPEELRENLQGSGIEICLYYLEVDPDVTEVL